MLVTESGGERISKLVVTIFRSFTSGIIINRDIRNMVLKYCPTLKFVNFLKKAPQKPEPMVGAEKEAEEATAAQKHKQE